MSKFPVASKPLARPSNRIPDHIRLIMAAFHLQVSCNRKNRRTMRRLVSLPPWRCCLAALWASFQPPPSPWPGFPIGYQTKIHLVIAAIRLQFCKWTKRRATWSIVALPPWHYCLTTLWASFQSPPSHWPSLPSDDFMSSGLRALYRSPLKGLPISPGLTMFNSPVHPLSRSLSRDSVRGNRYPRLCPQSQGHEGVSFTLPGMGTQSHLPVIRFPELQTFGCRICPDVGEKCCGAGEDIAEYLGVLQVPIGDVDSFIQIFWWLRPDSPGAVAFVVTWRGDFSSVTWCLPSRRLRSAICRQILSSTRRIYLRLPLLTQLDMPQGMCPYIEDHILDLPRRLGRLSGGPSLHLQHPGDALNLRLLLLRCSALKPSSWTRFTPQKKSPDSQRGFFGGRSLSSLCGPVGFRGVAPRHRPIHPEHFHQRFLMDRFPMGRIYYQLRVLCSGWQLPLMSLHDWWLQCPPFYIVTLSGCSDT